MAIRCAVLFLWLDLFALAQDAGLARLTFGVEQAASGAASPVEKLSLRLYFIEPVTARVSTWGDLRLSSLPQPISSSAAALPADLAKLSVTLPLAQLVRAGEFLVGAAYQVPGATANTSTVQAIASVGASIPLQAAAPTSQNRFLRQYYGGVRVSSKTRGHIVDVSLGQNEAVTGGGLHGMVARFDAYYALPLSSGNVVSLFGTAILRTSPRAATSNSGSDSYRVGVASDLFQILKALRIN